ncbi:unnamed protein product [Enterobius vermicularis]|uniref:Neprilysin n=1 Tax=Enterobius vermicularis TaxID=51028 RepID=A0A0N4VDJ1_ENTVE|nr:unnamed protein product [Enterobius vermicularis]
MNASADPCEDFYEFACGNWMIEHPIPDDAPSVSNFENLGQKLELALKNLLEEPHDRATEGAAVGKAKKFYQICLNETLIALTWRSTFSNLIKSFGGWPTLESNKSTEHVKTEELYGNLVAKYRADFLFKATVNLDDKNSEVYVLVIDQPTMLLQSSKAYGVDSDERQAYVTLIKDVLKIFDVNPQVIEDDVNSLLEFETQLSNITIPDGNRHDVGSLYSKSTVEELTQKYKFFNWTLFFNTLFQWVFNFKQNIAYENGTKIVIEKSTDVVLYGEEFFVNFNTLMSQFPKRTVLNYLSWSWFFKNMLRDLPDPFAMAVLKFYRALSYMQIPKLRWHNCVTRINYLMQMATSSMYVKRYFDHEAKKQVEEMIELIMQAFSEMLQSEEWISKETKKFAQEKVTAMNRKIGYPDYLNNISAVDEEYEGYKVYEQNFFRTKYNFIEAYQKDILRRINTRVRRDRLALAVNTTPNANEIIFPAGILQPVFYDKNFPSSMNFGGIGVVIGHEITHGFDDRGRLYDKYGNIRQWWDNATILEFEKRAKCITEQYAEFQLRQVNMSVDGQLTKGENIADNGGLKQAYSAYKKHEKEHPVTLRLPGINMTNDQLFFLNYAQIWCGAMNDKEAARKVSFSEHCPGLIRVRGPLSNSLDFARAFNCPLGSTMNPIRKCRVW